VEDGHAADPAAPEPNGGGHDCDAAASLDQRDQRQGVARLDEDAGMRVCEAAGAGEHLPGAEPLPQQQDAFVPKVGDLDRRASGQPVSGHHRGEDANRKQGAPLETIIAAPHRQAEVDLPAGHQLGGADATLFRELDIDSRSRSQVSRQERGQHVLDDLRGGGDPQSPDLAATQRLGVLGELVDTGQQLAAPAQQALKIANLPPQRGLREVQAGRSPRERARLGDRDEVAEVAELHGLLLEKHRLPLPQCSGQPFGAGPTVPRRRQSCSISTTSSASVGRP
jgi:hypothetical protein